MKNEIVPETMGTPSAAAMTSRLTPLGRVALHEGDPDLARGLAVYRAAHELPPNTAMVSMVEMAETGESVAIVSKHALETEAKAYADGDRTQLRVAFMVINQLYMSLHSTSHAFRATYARGQLQRYSVNLNTAEHPMYAFRAECLPLLAQDATLLEFLPNVGLVGRRFLEHCASAVQRES